jgi:hypothetical protein
MAFIIALSSLGVLRIFRVALKGDMLKFPVAG